MSHHRIRRQSWNVRVHSQATAFAVRQQLRTALEADLLSAFGQAFDALDVGDVNVHIPRLVLDLKLKDGEDLSSALRKALAEQLPEALHECIVTSPERAGVTRRTVRGDRSASLLNYLRGGRISWAHALPEQEPNDLTQMLRDEAQRWLGESGAVELFACLQREAAAAETLRASVFRLLQLLPGVQRLAFVEALMRSSLYAPGTPTVVADFVAADNASVAASARAREQGIAVLGVLAASPSLGEHLRLRIMCMVSLLTTGVALPESEVQVLLRECLALPDAALPGVLRTGVERGLALFSTRLHTVPPAKFVSGASDLRESADAPRVTRIDMSSASSQNDADTVQGWLAADAGLVLLHPFLTRFFTAVGVVANEHGRIPEADLPRAAALLHWLMSGRDAIHEFELTTIKLLLGLEPDSVLLVTEGTITDSDRAEADALLEAVITHWGVLGKTGVTGLRISFLQRRGLLRRNERGWQLQVEPESFDMLLGKLPWSISIVKLPWMTRPIFTEWPTP